MAYLGGAGYGDWKYNVHAFRERLDRVLSHLPWLRARHGFDAVAIQGTSGVWLAGHLLEFGVPVVLVRKPGETPHGNGVEGPSGVDISTVLIVDDFVASGNTVRRMAESLAKYNIRAVGVLEHSLSCWKEPLTEGALPRGHVRAGGDSLPIYGPK